MKKSSRIYVVDPNSFISSAIIRLLKHRGYTNIISNSGEKPNLCDKTEVVAFFDKKKPEYVLLTSGKSAGIMGNINSPADLMHDNLLTECHIIDAAHRFGVKKLLYLASSCCYPKHCPQPMKEDYLLTGPLEPTNKHYALAKLAGIYLCQAYRKQHKSNFICGIPASSFGPGDDFNTENAHVIGALIHRMHQAKLHGFKEVVIWGTGRPQREFIYVDDLADACIFVMEKYEDPEPINLGSSLNVSIKELAHKIKEVTQYPCKLVYDESKPDGMPIKTLDTQKLKNLGWKTCWPIKKGLERTYNWFSQEVRNEF